MSVVFMLLAAAVSQCTTLDQKVPAPLQGWIKADSAKQDRVVIGKAVTLPLQTTGTGQFEGRFPVRVAVAGRYGVAISHAAWVDIERGDKALVSPSHQHGPDCTSIRKIVMFDLVPGIYSLRLSKSPVNNVKALIIRWPE
jgi:hypothetical protein